VQHTHTSLARSSQHPSHVLYIPHAPCRSCKLPYSSHPDHIPHTPSLGRSVHHTHTLDIWEHNNLSQPSRLSYIYLSHPVSQKTRSCGPTYTYLGHLEPQTPFSAIRTYIHLPWTPGPTCTSLNYACHAWASFFHRVTHMPLSCLSCTPLLVDRTSAHTTYVTLT
jgi:hypothetical protein